MNPRAAFAFYNRGIARDRLSDLAGAVADFTAAIMLSDSGNADFYHNRGFSLRKLVRVQLFLPLHAQAASCSVLSCYRAQTRCHSAVSESDLTAILLMPS